MLFIAADDELTVFINGQLVLDRVEIEERSGYFGIALLGRGAGSRCEGSNIWVYNAPVFREGVCEASSGSTAGSLATHLRHSTAKNRIDSGNGVDFNPTIIPDTIAIQHTNPQYLYEQAEKKDIPAIMFPAPLLVCILWCKEVALGFSVATPFEVSWYDTFLNLFSTT